MRNAIISNPHIPKQTQLSIQGGTPLHKNQREGDMLEETNVEMEKREKVRKTRDIRIPIV